MFLRQGTNRPRALLAVEFLGYADNALSGRHRRFID
jgi:hypothetical protein